MRQRRGGELRLRVLERRVIARAFALALDPGYDNAAAARTLASLAGGDALLLERVMRRLRSTAPRSSPLNERVVIAVRSARDAVCSDGAVGAPGFDPGGRHARAAVTEAGNPPEKTVPMFGVHEPTERP